MRKYLEEKGYDLDEYVSQLLRDMKDDLCEIVCIDCDELDDAMEQILTAALATVKKNLGK